ncbi:MAG: hypothetical protein PHR82_08330, partial [Endomicrobiaceae bacterium]|nr:hypothetical protein [Endomicrobiaceae bacterium]
KILCILSILFLNVFLSNFVFSEEPKQINTDELKQTEVTSYLQKKITNGKNLIYCSTFQLAWNVLWDGLIKEPIKLSGTPKIQNMLNERLTNKEDISDNAYIAMVGFDADGIVEKIDDALLKKFNNKKGCGIKLSNPSDFLAYSYLFKNLEFKNKFEELNDTYFNGKTKVKTFGIKTFSDASRQVKILDYTDDNNFILKLESKSENDEIILAKIEPKETLLSTVDYVLQQIKNKKPMGLGTQDILQIPKFDFDILKEYSELTNRDFLNKNFREYFIAKAFQGIKFKLDEKGVVLESYAGIIGVKSVHINNDIKRLIFDKPFLFCLKEKNAKYPYFVMWVDNAELMLKINNDK